MRILRAFGWESYEYGKADKTTSPLMITAHLQLHIRETETLPLPWKYNITLIYQVLQDLRSVLSFELWNITVSNRSIQGIFAVFENRFHHACVTYSTASPDLEAEGVTGWFRILPSHECSQLSCNGTRHWRKRLDRGRSSLVDLPPFINSGKTQHVDDSSIDVINIVILLQF